MKEIETDNNVTSKTPEEIKKWMECCSITPPKCNECPAYIKNCVCDFSIVRCTLAYIQQLEEALLLMVYQYCQEDDSYMSHRYMTAGEHAFAALGIENYCSIETIRQRLDEMEGIHKTPLPEPMKEG